MYCVKIYAAATTIASTWIKRFGTSGNGSRSQAQTIRARTTRIKTTAKMVVIDYSLKIAFYNNGIHRQGAPFLDLFDGPHRACTSPEKVTTYFTIQ